MKTSMKLALLGTTLFGAVVAFCGMLYVNSGYGLSGLVLLFLGVAVELCAVSHYLKEMSK
jgi:hypothetical protein